MPLKVLHTAGSSTSGQHWLLCSLLSYTSPWYSFIFSNNSWLQSALKTPLLPYCPSAPFLLLMPICFAVLLPFSLLLAVDQTVPAKPRVIKSPKALTIHQLLFFFFFFSSVYSQQQHQMRKEWEDMQFDVSVCAHSLGQLSIYFNCTWWSLTQASVRIIFVGISKHLKMFQLNFSGSCHMLSLRATKFMGRFYHSSYSWNILRNRNMIFQTRIWVAFPLALP